jgi:hypothetical protein
MQFSKLAKSGAQMHSSKLQAGATNAAKSLSGLRGVIGKHWRNSRCRKAFGDAQAFACAKALSRLTEYKQTAGAQQEAARLAKKFEVSVTDTAGALAACISLVLQGNR